MSDTRTYPNFRASAALQRGTRLSPAQRMSSKFDPEPLLFGRRLRPGGLPVEFSESQFEANENKVLELLRSDSIVLERKEAEGTPWSKLPAPTPSEWAAYKARRAQHNEVEGDRRLSELSEQLIEKAAPVEPTPMPVPEKALEVVEKAGSQEADQAFTAAVEKVVEAVTADQVSAVVPTDPSLEELEKLTAPEPVKAEESKHEEKKGGKKGKGK